MWDWPWTLREVPEKASRLQLFASCLWQDCGKRVFVLAVDSEQEARKKYNLVWRYLFPLITISQKHRGLRNLTETSFQALSTTLCSVRTLPRTVL